MVTVTYRMTKDVVDAVQRATHKNMQSALQNAKPQKNITVVSGKVKQTIELISTSIKDDGCFKWEFTPNGDFHIDFQSTPMKKQRIVILDHDDPKDRNMKKAAALCFFEFLEDNPGEWNNLLGRTVAGKQRKGRALLKDKLYVEDYRIDKLDIAMIIGFVQSKAVKSRGSTVRDGAAPVNTTTNSNDFPLDSFLKTEFTKLHGILANIEQRLAQSVQENKVQLKDHSEQLIDHSKQLALYSKQLLDLHDQTTDLEGIVRAQQKELCYLKSLLPSERNSHRHDDTDEQSLDSRHPTSDADFTVSSMDWNLRDTSESVGWGNETGDDQGSMTTTAASSSSPDTPDSLDSLQEVEFSSRQRPRSYSF